MADAHRRPDLVRRRFAVDAPDRLWVADLSYLRCWEGVVFFAFVLDAYSRRVVGWQLASHMRTTLVLDALRMALGQRRAGADVALVHHSDRGSQPELNRSSQQRVRCDESTGYEEALRWDSPQRRLRVRLSSRRLARRAGRSGDSRVRTVRGPSWARPASPCSAAVTRASR